MNPGSMGNQSASLTHSSERRLVPRVLILVGFMGAGKTSVGKRLAEILQWRFEDLDDSIQTRAGRSIEDIFRDSGEAEFRRYERVAFHELLTESKGDLLVIALGGGTFVQSENVALMQRPDIASIFLDAPVAELFERCQLQAIDRPLRRDEPNFRELYETRRGAYMAASCRVETSAKSISQIAEEIVRTLGISEVSRPRTET